jgi:hypothetical protein
MEKPSHSKLSAIQGKQEAPATGWGRGFRQPAQRPTPSDRDAGDMAERANALDVSMFQNKKPLGASIDLSVRRRATVAAGADAKLHMVGNGSKRELRAGAEGA